MKRNRWIEMITDPTKNFLAFFVVGTLMFGIIGDGVSSLFWDVLGEWVRSHLGLGYEWFQFFVVVGLVLILLSLIYLTRLTSWLKRWSARLPFVQSVPVEPNVKPLDRTYPGLVVAMSAKEDSPAERAILHHWNNGTAPHLQHCWLICTQRSLPYAQHMVQRLIEKGVTEAVTIHYGSYPLETDDPVDAPLNLLIPDEHLDDPHYTHRLVNAIYADAEQKGLDESEVVADYTGATKNLTAGILLACLTPDRPLEYLTQQENPILMAVRIAYQLKRL